MGGKPDFEQILPKVVAGYLPIGCKGLLVAALVAAFMSTFVSTANSGVAYIVNDIYRRYINPAAPQRKLVWLGYLWTVIVILAGIGIGFMTDSIHGVTKWLTSALVPAFVAPNVLKWHWWRFNGWGFFAGMVAGTAAAIVPAVVRCTRSSPSCWYCPSAGWPPSWSAWPPRRKTWTCSSSSTRPSDPGDSGDRSIRRCRGEARDFQANHDFGRDAFNILVGIVWQIAMVAMPMYLVIQQYGAWPSAWPSSSPRRSC